MDCEDFTLAIFLRVSRFFGAAPYRVMHASEISLLLSLYSRMLFFCYGGTMLTALLLNAQYRSSKDIVTLWFKLWSFESLIALFFTGILFLGIFQSPSRMRRTFYFWKRVKMIRKSVGHVCVDLTQRLSLSLFTVVQLAILFFTLGDIFLFPSLCSVFIKTIFMLIFINFGYFITNIITAYFVFVGMMINSSFRAINEQLVAIITEVQSDEKVIVYTKQKSTVARIEYIPDTLGMLVRVADKKKVHKRLRSLARAYVSTCGLVQQHNRSEELLLVLLLTYIVMNLVTILWYTVTCLLEGAGLLISMENFFWYFIHVFRGLLLATPWHAMKEELERTRSLLCKIMSEVRSTGDPLLAELNVFMIHLTVNQPSYSTLGMYTMKRPLILAMMAFASTCQVAFKQS